MSYQDDIYLEDFERDDSDVSSITDVESMFNDDSLLLKVIGNKRPRQDEDVDAEYSSDCGIVSHEDSSFHSVSSKRFAPLQDESVHSSLQNISSSQAPPGSYHVRSQHANEIVEFSNSLDEFSDIDWECLMHLEENIAPDSDWHAEFLKHKAEIMARAAAHDDGEQLEFNIEHSGDEPWHPFDPDDTVSADTENDAQSPAICAIHDEDIICFGMIHWIRSKLLHRTSDWPKNREDFSTVRGEYEASDTFLFEIFRPDDGPAFFLRSPKSSDTSIKPTDYIAVLNRETSNILSDLTNLCTFTAYCSVTDWVAAESKLKPDSEDGIVFVNIVIYGQYQNRQKVGSLLNAKRIFLQEPDHRDTTKGYKNPHFLDLNEVFPDLETNPAFFKLQQASSILDIANINETTTLEAPQTMRQRVAAAFRSLSRSQHLQRISADSRIRTILEPYQEEALDFIAQRETGPVPNAYSLWRHEVNPDGSDLFTHSITGCNTTEKPMELGGGILADEMGLGKTLTMLCTIIRTLDAAKQFSESDQGNSGTSVISSTVTSRSTLVVVPSPLILREWKLEMEKHCPNILNISFYHGQGRKGKGQVRLIANSDIVLTTYHTMAHEISDSTSPLWDIEWFRIILDEAHIIRCSSTQLFKSVMNLRSKYRWCLTGTPIQNSPEDLAALISFIRAHPMSDVRKFRRHIARPLEKRSHEGVENLRLLLDSVCLRRTKKLLKLPEAMPEIKTIEMSVKERHEYNHVRDMLIQAINQNVLLPKQQKRKHLGVFQLHMQLRRLCNHGTFQKTSLENEAFDPQHAIRHLKQQKQSFCDFCGVKVTGIQGVEEENGGTFTICGHLICHRCRPAIEITLKNVDQSKQQTVQCSICSKVLCGDYFLGREQDSPSTRKSRQNLSAWEYFNRDGCSAKIHALIEDIANNRSAGKSIIFSCWTRTLDLVSIFLRSRGISFCRIDGTHSTLQREKVLEEYQREDTTRILLMTTGTGAFGLNLTVANCVHILEPQWNPMAEDQAIARVLRFGQKRNVRIVRYLMKDTVEDKEIQSQQLLKIGYAKAGWMGDA